MIFDIEKADPRDHWLIYIIGIILCLIVVTFLVISVYRIGYIFNNDKKVRFRSLLLTLLSSAVNFPEKKDLYAGRIKYIVKRKWQQEMLLDELVTMCYSFQGVYERRAEELYESFGLHEVSKRKLKSRKWYRIVEGLIELSIIGDIQAYPDIIPLLNHKKLQVRKQSKIAVVEIAKVNGLLEMEQKMGIMSNWTFISILSILHRHPFKLTTEQLMKLTNSENPATRRLAGHLERYAVIK